MRYSDFVDYLGDKMLPIDEIEKRDKRNSSIHEAGHAVVAFANGVIVKAWLERSKTKDAICEKIWVGHIQNIWGHLGANADKSIGIAGVVAECFEDDPEVTAEEIVDYWRDEIIIPSPSDLEFMPADWSNRLEAVEVALRIISTQRAFLESIVSELVDHELVSADQMVALAGQLYTHSND